MQCFIYKGEVGGYRKHTYVMIQEVCIILHIARKICSLCAEGLHFSAFHYYIILYVQYITMCYSTFTFQPLWFHVQILCAFIIFLLHAESLEEFTAHHTVDKLCLPCKLVLPKPGGGGGVSGDSGRGRAGARGGEGGEGVGAHQGRRRPVTMQEALKTGAGQGSNLIKIISIYCQFLLLM